MRYRVIDTKTKEDITDKYCWVIRPDGNLYINEYGDLTGYPDAMYLPESANVSMSAIDTLNKIKELLKEAEGIADCQEFGLSYSQAISYLDEIKELFKG